MRKNKRRLYYIANGKVLKVRVKDKFETGDEVCQNIKTAKFAKHNVRHKKENWNCKIMDVVEASEIKHIGSIWGADIILSGKPEFVGAFVKRQDIEVLPK